TRPTHSRNTIFSADLDFSTPRNVTLKIEACRLSRAEGRGTEFHSVRTLRLGQSMTGKRATMPVLRGTWKLAGAHDVPAHSCAPSVRARWARQRAITASAKLAVSRSRSGNWATMLSRSDRRGATTGRSDEGRRRVRGAPRRHFFAPKVLGRSAQGKLRTAK